MFIHTSRSSLELAILIFYFFWGGGGGGGGGVSGGREGGAFLNNKTKYHCFRFSVNRRVLFFLGKEKREARNLSVNRVLKIRTIDNIEQS